MNDFFLINQIFFVLIIILGLWLGFWVLFSDKKAKINQLFFLMTILIILWNIFAYLGFSAAKAETSLIWYRLNFGAVSLFFLVAYYFAQYFPQEKKRSNLLNYFAIIITSFFFIISVFTSFIIENVIIKEWGAEIIFGDLGGTIGFKGFSFLLIIIILTYFLKKYFNLSLKEKLKAQYFLIGAVIFALSNIIFNIIFPLVLRTIEYALLGDFSAIFFLGFIGYAIVKQQLFGIKVVLAYLFVGLIAILLAIDAFVLAREPFLQIIKGVILVVFLIFGYSLIKSVLREIKLREESEKMSSQLATANIKLKAAYEKLEKLDKAKSEFISIASHQLRTPLTAIKGYISMIREEIYGNPPEKMEKPLESINASNERLIKLVNDLLSVSRIETGRIEMNLEKTLIEEIVSNVIGELENEAKNKNIYLKFEKLKKPLPKISVDKGKIREAISNLVDNAIKYTEKGGIIIKLKIENSKLKIIISDTGAGMTEYELSKIFESFSRGTAGARLYTEGVGLGLYITRRFIEMHKGKIWAESKGKGKGSVFYIELPLK